MFVRSPRTPRAPSPGSDSSGSAAIGAVFWVLAFVIFVIPFLSAPDTPDKTWEDFARAEADIPFEVDVSDFEQEFGAGLAGHIEASAESWFSFESPGLVASGVLDRERLEPGARAYQTHCFGCHGSMGDGGGPAARFLDPRPRNFRKRLFKFTSTSAGARPRRRDLFQTITRGLVGSSMPDFRLLNEETRWNLVEYVRYLAMRGEFERALLDLAWEEEELPEEGEVTEAAEFVFDRWSEERTRQIYPGAAETPLDPASIERGRELFNNPGAANCSTCHGSEGRGDGPTANDYEDDWGYPIRPRDLTTGLFRAGAESTDIYRTIASGIKGTPMGSFEGALAPEQIWDLVHFVQSLGGAEGVQ